MFAAREGTVAAAGVSATLGKFIRLSFDDGFSAAYAHLDSVLVSEGEPVRQNQLIAYSGSTGRSTGPHLHFSIYKDGQYSDPELYVSLPYKYDLDAALGGGAP